MALWTAYNRHLAHVMRSTGDEAAAGAAIAPDGSGPVTVGFLMDDYWTGSPQYGLVLGTGSVHESQMNHWVSVLSELLPPKTVGKLDYKK